jgi:hypothetical protein
LSKEGIVRIVSLASGAISSIALVHATAPPGAGPGSWVGEFSPIAAGDWNVERAAHLVERAGFGGTPEEILDSNGDLKMTTDFRRVYATMIQEWMGFQDSKAILERDYQPLGAFA